jgi:hypothetical protein
MGLALGLWVALTKMSSEKQRQDIGLFESIKGNTKAT